MKTLHSLPPVIDENAHILILGSMPGEESLRQKQYYAHPRNHFWPILYALFETAPHASYTERIAFLKNQRIALWDVIETCHRRGSSDGTISNPKANDIASLLNTFPNIELIILNGTKAEKTFLLQVVKKSAIQIPWIRVSSTSPIPGKYNKTFEEKIIEWKKAIQSVHP